jgi:hypothetical protein
MTAVRRPAGENGTEHDPEPTRKKRRVCAVCGEKLSSYNNGPTCYAHTVGLPWKGPNNRP